MAGGLNISLFVAAVFVQALALEAVVVDGGIPTGRNVLGMQRLQPDEPLASLGILKAGVRIAGIVHLVQG